TEPKSRPAYGSRATSVPATSAARQGRVLGEALGETWQERLVAFAPGDVQELLALVEARHKQFSPVSLATALHRLASSSPRVEHHRCSGFLSHLTEQLQTRPEGFRAQSLANASWALAKLQWQRPAFMEAVIASSLPRIEGFKPKELSLLLWGLASSTSTPSAAKKVAAAAVTAEFRRRGSEPFDAQSLATLAYSAGTITVAANDPLWAAVGAGSEDRVSEFSDRQLANLVWAFATVASDDGRTLCTRVEEVCSIGSLAPIDLSLVSWAMAKLLGFGWLKASLNSGEIFLTKTGKPEFWQQVGQAVVAKGPDWQRSDTRNIATLLYSMALVEQAEKNDLAFRKLAHAACARPREFSVQGLTNTVWSFATACYAEAPWFAAIAQEVLDRQPGEFEALDVANCLWAFAAVSHDSSSPALLKLKGVGRAILPDFTAQNLAISLWSLAALEIRDEAFFEASADQFVQKLGECKAQELNNTLWACATACVRIPWLFLKADLHAMSIGLSEFKMHELSIMLWAHGTAGVCHHAFFDAVVEEVLEHRGIESCTPREVANSAWAYSTIIGRLHVPWMSAVAKYSCRHIAEFDMQGIGNVLWSFATVAAFSEPLLKVGCRETALRCLTSPADMSHNVAQVLTAAQAGGYVDVGLLESATDLFLDRSEGEMGCRELLNLCNAAVPAAQQMGGKRWQRLEDAFQARVMHLVDILKKRVLFKIQIQPTN
ncbi:unnamed protein product, partial [Polarella glacialis]